MSLKPPIIKESISRGMLEYELAPHGKERASANRQLSTPESSEVMNIHPVILTISIVACIIMHATPQPAYAEGNTPQTSITSNFPNYFTASLKHQSTIPIEDISLVFHVTGQEVERYYREPLTESTNVDIDYVVRTDTNHRYIPPGSTVTYFFEIVYTGNKTVRTPKSSFMYLDSDRLWQSRTSNNVTIVFYGEDDDTAISILETALSTSKSVGNLFGMPQDSPITIVLYESWEAMLPAIRFSSKTVQQELITLGQAHPDAGIIMLIAGDKDVLASTRHETIHMLVYSKLEDSKSIVPFWFNEGIAEFQNPTHVASYNRAISEAIQTSSLPNLDYFINRPNTPEEIWLMYAMGSRFTEFLITSNGTTKMQLLLEGLSTGKSFEASFQEVYSLKLIDAQNEWRQIIGAPTLPTSEQQTVLSETPEKDITASPTSNPRPIVDEMKSGVSSCNQSASNDISFLPEHVALLLTPPLLSLWKRRKNPLIVVPKHASKSALVSEEQNILAPWV